MGLVKEGGTAVPTPNKIASPEVLDNRDATTKRIQAQGCIQAAVQAPVLQMFCTDFDTWMGYVEMTSKMMLKWVRENS